MAASEKDIENIIKMLDEASATTARINLNVAEDGNDGEIRKLKHDGRCDVGSEWATGKVKIHECLRSHMLDEENKKIYTKIIKILKRRVFSVIKILVFCILIKIYKS